MTITIAELSELKTRYIALGSPSCWAVFSGIRANQIHGVIMAAEVDGFDAVSIRISSGGGDSWAGIQIHQILKNTNLLVHTHAVAGCKSAALTMFLGGDIRTSEPGTEFMAHCSTISSNDTKKIDIPSNDHIKKIYRASGFSQADTDAAFSEIDKELSFYAEEAYTKKWLTDEPCSLKPSGKVVIIG